MRLFKKHLIMAFVSISGNFTVCFDEDRFKENPFIQCKFICLLKEFCDLKPNLYFSESPGSILKS